MTRVWIALRPHPSGVLLLGQLLVVLAYPFLEARPRVARCGRRPDVVVFSAVAAVRLTPALSWVALLLGVPAMVFAVVEAVQQDTDWIVLTSALVHAPFYFYVSYAMIRYLFHDDQVTRDELFATGAAFTVVAWAFAYVYAAAQVISPGSSSARTRGAGVVQPAVPVIQQPDQRRPVRRAADRRTRPLTGDDRAGGRSALRRAGGRPAGRTHGRASATASRRSPRTHPNSLAISPHRADLRRWAASACGSRSSTAARKSSTWVWS